MSYNITIKRRAIKSLENLHDKNYQSVRDAIRKLAENPRPNGCLKLKDRDGYPIRIGVYRVIYQINDKDEKITVIDIGHRRDIYR